MDKILKIDDQVMKTLDLKTINRIICQTDKGTLSLQIRKGEKNYHLVLDAVPLEKAENKELMDLLFPAKQPATVSTKNISTIFNEVAKGNRDTVRAEKLAQETVDAQPIYTPPVKPKAPKKK